MTNKSQTAADCCDDYDPNSLSAEAAAQRIRQAARPVPEIEGVAVRAALGRVVARDVASPVDVPNHTNSAMDGYALKGSDLPADGEAELAVIGTSWAGRPFDGEVNAGECVRIMTGAVMANGTDTVVMQEHVERIGDTLRIGAGQKTGQHVRHAGEDLAAGAIAIQKGRRLTPADLGLAASLGISELPVTRKPRVAFFSNGDELRSVGQPLEIGELYDSNRYTLYGMLSRAEVDMVDLGVVPDDPDALRKVFQDAARCADVVITSAGASVGDADYVNDILKELGEVDFWKIAIKPGRPLAFGKIGDSLFFGLPGNPVSAMVTFYIFVLPVLRYMMGESETQPLQLRARCETRLKKRPGRMEYQRGVLGTKDGELVVNSTGWQGSGILSSMSLANSFIILPVDSEGVKPGDMVDVQPFAGII
ncbi:MAG: gephyrin-like molybdotransferase Glp [Pseudomonadota bacterium]|nr:gephyrin-like molybdotransferase Glp [Pseudomonadota bacterium]